MLNKDYEEMLQYLLEEDVNFLLVGARLRSGQVERQLLSNKALKSGSHHHVDLHYYRAAILYDV